MRVRKYDPKRHRGLNDQGKYICEVTGLNIAHLDVPICKHVLQTICRSRKLNKSEYLIYLADYLSKIDGQHIDMHLLNLIRRDPLYQRKQRAAQNAEARTN